MPFVTTSTLPTCLSVRADHRHRLRRGRGGDPVVGVRFWSTMRTATTLRMTAAAAVTATSFVVRQRRRRDDSTMRSSDAPFEAGGGSASGASSTIASAVSESSDT